MYPKSWAKLWCQNINKTISWTTDHRAPYMSQVFLTVESMQSLWSVKEQKDSKIEVSDRQKPGGNFSRGTKLAITELREKSGVSLE